MHYFRGMFFLRKSLPLMIVSYIVDLIGLFFVLAFLLTSDDLFLII